VTRKAPAPAPARGTQNKVPLTVWLDPIDKERVAVVARRRELGVSKFGAKAVMVATTMAEQQDELDAQLPMRRIAL
jgi:hypothetical protein